MNLGNIFDKLLLLLLIITLPVSVYFASKFNFSNNNSNPNDQPIAQNNQANTSDLPVQPNSQIKISQVFLDEKDNKLIINGIAPVANLNIMISIVVTKIPLSTPKTEITQKDSTKSALLSKKTKEATISASSPPNTNILGETIEMKAVKADENGEFIFSYPVDKKMQLVELRFDQLDATATIQYNLVEKTRTL